MKILLVEDEYGLRESLSRHLKLEKHTVDTAKDGEEAIQKVDINEYEIVILDLNLPKVDGIEVCKHIRDNKILVGIIMLTARINVEDKVLGLNVGADDYIEKPFSTDELLARIESLARRMEDRPENIVTSEDGEIKVDMKAKRAWKNDKELDLTKKEYQILEYLLRHKGQIISQEDLFTSVWHDEADIFSKTLKAQMNNLRRKIDEDGEDSIIETHKNKGYLIK